MWHKIKLAAAGRASLGQIFIDENRIYVITLGTQQERR